MQTVNQSPHLQMVSSEDDDDSSTSSASSEPCSSSPATRTHCNEDSEQRNQRSMGTVGSRLFTPFREIGVVSGRAPFALIPHLHDESQLCVPIGNRFQIVSVDHLQPALVSRAAPGEIIRAVPDPSLQITALACRNSQNQSILALFQRTMAVEERALTGNVVDMQHWGRIKTTTSTNKLENVALVAVLLAADHHDDADSDDSPDIGQTNQSQLAIYLASRRNLTLRSKLPLPFEPTAMTHPATYTNKVLVAGVVHNYGNDYSAEPCLCLHNIRSGERVHNFSCLPNNCGRITTMEQSPAIDTIAVGTENGQVHVVNIKHDKLLFSLQHTSAVESTSFRTDATALKYGVAPMAVGCRDGGITVWDLSTDDDSSGKAILCRMRNVHSKGVSKLCYLQHEPLLLSSGITSNSIITHIFDSPDHTGRVLRQRRGHMAPPSLIRYLNASGGIMANSVDGTDASSCQIVSASVDRTFRVFSTARSVLDKEYSQGSGLQKKARKLGLEVTDLLLPPVVSFSICQTRRRDWGDIVTIHKDHSIAYVWSSRTGAQNGPVLRQRHWAVSSMKEPPPPETNATSVAITSCGHFALVGTRGGEIFMYNIQSGISRGRFPPPSTLEKPRSKPKAMPGNITSTMKNLEKSIKLGKVRPSNLDKRHEESVVDQRRNQRIQSKLRSGSHIGFPVVGLAVDSLNKTVLSVGSDAKLILWNLVSKTPHKRSPFMLPCPATKLVHMRESNLAGIALSDFTVLLFDCVALAPIRRLGRNEIGHKGPLTDMGFSPDGRTLCTTSLDGSLRVWDVPLNTCVDWLSFASPPTSLAISPTGEFLATTHVAKVGISIFSDRSFHEVHTIGAAPSLPFAMDDPVPVAGVVDTEDHGESLPQERRVNGSSTVLNQDKGPIVPKEPGLVTLSGLPSAHWKNLFHLELVKERNKPKEPPKKPPSTPFFLQARNDEKLLTTGSEPETSEWATSWSNGDDLPFDSRVISSTDNEAKRPKLTHRSRLAALLMSCSKSELTPEAIQFGPVTEYISTLGPSAIDVELESLCSGVHDATDGFPLLLLAARWLCEACFTRERFEAVNAYLHRYLQLHSATFCELDSSTDILAESLMKGEELMTTLRVLRKSHDDATNQFHGKLQHTVCLLRHLSRI